MRKPAPSGLSAARGEGAHGLLVFGVRRRPARMPLRLAQRLLQRGLDPHLIGVARQLAQGVQHIHRPGADERLVEHVFVAAIGRRPAFDVAQARTQEPAPRCDLTSPFVGTFREHSEPGSRVLAALGVMRGGRQHRMRPAFRPLGVGFVKEGRRHSEAVRRAADFVERKEAIVAIERGILDALRHHGPRELLKLHRKSPRSDLADLIASMPAVPADRTASRKSKAE